MKQKKVKDVFFLNGILQKRGGLLVPFLPLGFILSLTPSPSKKKNSNVPWHGVTQVPKILPPQKKRREIILGTLLTLTLESQLLCSAFLFKRHSIH